MARFYALDIQPDLFGGVVLTRTWGRIGVGGQSKAEHHADEAQALAALQKRAARKQRKGYVTLNAKVF